MAPQKLPLISGDGVLSENGASRADKRTCGNVYGESVLFRFAGSRAFGACAATLQEVFY